MNHTERASVLVQALPYIQQYKGKTIVVKYGGNAMTSDELKTSVINDLVLMKCVGINVVVVHGGGPDISSYLKKINKESAFVNGLRYTDEETMEIVQMLLGGKVNKDIVKLVENSGGKAIGLSGMDGSMIKAKKIQGEIDLGYVGEITEINTDIITQAADSGYLPIIASIAVGDDNHAYNINADTCAAKIASALKAESLILLTDVPGVMQDPNDNSTLISELRLHDIPALEMSGVIKGGMIPKIQCCVESVRRGVKKAQIIDGRVPHSLILELFSTEGIGTMIY